MRREQRRRGGAYHNQHRNDRRANGDRYEDGCEVREPRAYTAERLSFGRFERQLAPALHYVAQQHCRQAQSSQQQPQPAQRLKRGQVRVLDTMKGRQALRCRGRIESVIRKRFLERPFERRPAVDQKISEPLLPWKRPHKIIFGNDKFALKDAIL